MKENNMDIPLVSDFDIAIVSMEGRFPGASNLEQYWKNLYNGAESVVELSDEELNEAGISKEVYSRNNYVKSGSYIEDYDMFAANFFGYSGKEAAMMDPQHRIFLELCWQTLEKAGCNPEKYKGCIGVFAGTTFNSYMLNNILKGRELNESSDRFFMQINNDKDNLATRVSYKLNLMGPSLSLQTACSTSLVAVHYACQSLNSYECDMALAGGVTVRSPHKSGYEYEPEMILSKDGHCRPFDENASGTIFGSGAGVVALKRFKDAINDGDAIHAVIKASAINNDGAEKVGYTAPGRKGQERVLASALALSGLEKGSISAIEAHGTGTALGDPIEFESINKVYGTGRHGKPVAIGSVKGNIGHLECASGIASLIKMVLCLEHKMLVPSINYNKANSHLRIEDTNFYVNTECKEWISDEIRCCCVSSFGIGGTNAHVILQEGIERKNKRDISKKDVYLFSAENPEILNIYMKQIGQSLKSAPLSMEAVAHQLRYGKRELPYRTAVVADNSKQLIEKLLNGYYPATLSKKLKKVIFMFPGQGTQYRNMAKEIYKNSDVFRNILDKADAILKECSTVNLKEVLFQESSQNHMYKDINDTRIAQPVIYVVEYALAKLLESWNIYPDAMIGHSIGEYVTATIAGVLSFEDGIQLVAKRGELISNLKRGAMLGIMEGEAEVRKILGNKVSIAAINGPNFTVVSGEYEEIDALAERLKEKNTDFSKLHTSHAFHSYMMEPASREFKAYISKVRMGTPTIPYISNVTGNWVEEEEAVNPDYWVKHLRSTVQFSKGIKKLINEGNVFLELGPGNVLSTFTKNHNNSVPTITFLPHAADNLDSYEYILDALGKIWTAGYAVDWAAYETEVKEFLKVGLPVYPFVRERFWITPAQGSKELTDEIHIMMTENSNNSSLLLPRTETEKSIASIFTKVLGITQLDIRDNFFEMGGHSLLAIQLLTRVNNKYKTQIQLNDFVKISSVLKLSEQIDSMINAELEVNWEDDDLGLPTLVEDMERRYEPFPLTEMQEAQWLGRISSFDGGNVAAHVYFETENANIDLERLEASWQVMIERHEMLRTILLPEGGQQILKMPLYYVIKNLDLRKESQDTIETELLRVREEMDHVVRPINQWPLFEIRTTQLPDNRLRIHFSIDLLICDVGSMRILQSDWAKVYEHPYGQLPKLEVSFRDYVLLEKKLKNSDIYKKSDAYWEDKVQKLPDNTAPELPMVKDISEINEIRFKRWSFVIPTQKWEKIKQLAHKSALSPSTIIMTAFAHILGTWSKSQEFCINTPIINRMPVHPQIKQLLGEFASFAPIAITLNREKSFLELAHEIQDESWKNLENRYISGTSILRKLAKYRRGNTGAVFPVVFTSTIVQNVEGENDFYRLFGERKYLISQTPQVWLDHTAMEIDDGLLLSWHAIEEMFPSGLLDTMWKEYQYFINMLAEDTNEWRTVYYGKLAKSDFIIEDEANKTDKEADLPLLHKSIIESGYKYLDKEAIITSDTKISYKQLLAGTKTIALRLKQLNTKPGELIAIVMEKGYEQIFAVMGILASGGAYLPLDGNIAKDRFEYILHCAGVKTVITQKDLYEKVCWVLEKNYQVIVIDDSILSEEDYRIEEDIYSKSPDGLAYTIFTSGSTGAPKGVMISHRAAQNTIVEINKLYNVTHEDSCFALSELNFDLSVYDIFGILGVGGTMVIPDKNTSRDTEHWLNMLEKYPVSIWNSVPALVRMLVEYAGIRNKKLPMRLFLMSGDWIPVYLPDKIRDLTDEPEIISLGGATEAAIWSIQYPIHKIDKKWKSIPYGKPLANQKFYILNKQLMRCPIWVTGDLYIAGEGLAEGYINEEELTKNVFIIHPLTGERIYRTGDIGRYLPDGNIEFLGREDFQVKINGFRVELEEIEAAIINYPGIKNVIVNAVGASHESQRLVGYLITDDVSVDFEDLKEQIGKLLTDYMIPQEYVILDEFPLSANGKVDRKALPEPAIVKKRAAVDISSDELAQKLITVFADTLGIEREEIDPEANFFAQGGDSITGIQIISKASKQGIEITPQMFFENTTISELVQAMHQAIGQKEEHTEKYEMTPYQNYLLSSRQKDIKSMYHTETFKLKVYLEPEKIEKIYQKYVHENVALRAILSSDLSSIVVKSVLTEPEIDFVDITRMTQEEIHGVMFEVSEDLVNETEGYPVSLCVFNEDVERIQYIVIVWNELFIDEHSIRLLLENLYILHGKNENQLTVQKYKQFYEWKQIQEKIHTNTGANKYLEMIKKERKEQKDTQSGTYSNIRKKIIFSGSDKCILSERGIRLNDLLIIATTIALKRELGKDFLIDVQYRELLGELEKPGYNEVIGQLTMPFALPTQLISIHGKESIKKAKQCIHQLRETFISNGGDIVNIYGNGTINIVMRESISHFQWADRIESSIEEVGKNYPLSIEYEICQNDIVVLFQFNCNIYKANVIESVFKTFENVIGSILIDEGVDYTIPEDFVDGVRLDEDDFDTLMQMLSENN